MSNVEILLKRQVCAFLCNSHNQGLAVHFPAILISATCKPGVACRANVIAVAVVATLVVALVDFICGSLLWARCIFKA